MLMIHDRELNLIIIDTDRLSLIAIRRSGRALDDPSQRFGLAQPAPASADFPFPATRPFRFLNLGALLRALLSSNY